MLCKSRYVVRFSRSFCVQTPSKTNPNAEAQNEKKKRIVVEKTPKGRFEDRPHEEKEERHRDAEKEPLKKWPDGINPNTGERGGPAGPEPTRFGDWERKGRVTDF